jgi:RNA polymerase sigma-70 factor (ECF subfamily)
MPVNQCQLVDPLYDLIQGCIRKDRYSQSRLYDHFAPSMFGVCLRYASNRQEAEEILQEGFMKVFENVHQFRNEGSFEGWIRKIMVNCALQKYRSKSKMYAVVNIDMPGIEPQSNDEIINRIGTKELLKLVQLLPPAYRMVFNLFVFEGMKHREIAKHLGISEGTSKSNLSDARVILQKAVTNSMRVAQQNFI